MWCKRVQDKNWHQRGHTVRIWNMTKTTLSDRSVDLYLYVGISFLIVSFYDFPSSHTHWTESNNQGNAFSRWDLADWYLILFQHLSSHPPNLLPTDATSLQQRQFFAAQTLHSKWQSDVHQLPPASLGSLRDSLSTHFANHASDSVSAVMENCPSNLRLFVMWLGIFL